MAHDDGSGCPGDAPGVVGGSVVDDDQEVNAGYGAARAHSGGDSAADVVCSNDGCYALRLRTMGPTVIVHNKQFTGGGTPARPAARNVSDKPI